MKGGRGRGPVRSEHLSPTSRARITRAGVPKATTRDGIDRDTTEPAPMIVCSPTSTRWRSTAPMPTAAPRPIRQLPPVTTPGARLAPSSITES